MFTTSHKLHSFVSDLNMHQIVPISLIRFSPRHGSMGLFILRIQNKRVTKSQITHCKQECEKMTNL